MNACKVIFGVMNSDERVRPSGGADGECYCNNMRELIFCPCFRFSTHADLRHSPCQPKKSSRERFGISGRYHSLQVWKEFRFHRAVLVCQNFSVVGIANVLNDCEDMRPFLLPLYLRWRHYEEVLAYTVCVSKPVEYLAHYPLLKSFANTFCFQFWYVLPEGVCSNGLFSRETKSAHRFMPSVGRQSDVPKSRYEFLY